MKAHHTKACEMDAAKAVFRGRVIAVSALPIFKEKNKGRFHVNSLHFHLSIA